MALNPFLHPRNPYRTRPNFKEMAKKDEAFKKVIKVELDGKVSLDFRDREAVRILTQTLLKLDFDLDVALPPENLVPTLPLRFNYLLWIEDLLDENDDHFDEDSEILGLDIGVGSSCIYPILGAAHFNWRMRGTDIHPQNLKHAQENVTRNKLEDKIRLSAQNPSQTENVFAKVMEEEKEDDVLFTMCNPPFYEADETESEDHGEKTVHFRSKIKLHN